MEHRCNTGGVDCETEFFTGFGWKKVSDYQAGDLVLQYHITGIADLITPIAYVKEPCESMLKIESKYGINQKISEDQYMVFLSSKGSKLYRTSKDVADKQNNSEYGFDAKFLTSFYYSGSGMDLTDEQIELMCAVICDGSFKKDNPNSLFCRFHIKKDRKKDKLREIFDKCRIKYSESVSAADGYIDFYIHDTPIRTKKFDSIWYCCNNHQLKVICDNIMFWDGSTNKTKAGTIRNKFSTNVLDTADFIQFAYSACGYRATIGMNNRVGQEYLTAGKIYTRKSIDYWVSVTNRNTPGMCGNGGKDTTRPKFIKEPTKDGLKYNFIVPSGNIVTRRNNRIFVTSGYDFVIQ